MPQIRIDVSDEAWPQVVDVLTAAAGPRPSGSSVHAWVEQVTVHWFAAEIAGLTEPPPPPEPRGKRIRHSQAD